MARQRFSRASAAMQTRSAGLADRHGRAIVAI
jgi:hypothetical protein